MNAWIDRGFVVRGEDCNSCERLDALQEVVHFKMRVAIVAASHLRKLREERVRLVEQPCFGPCLLLETFIN